MNFEIKNKIFAFTIFYPSILMAGEFCSMQPENYDGKRNSINLFEKNIANKMTDIYQNEYPRLSDGLKMIKNIEKAINEFNHSVSRNYVETIQGESDLIFLLDQNFQFEEDFNDHIKKIKMKKYLTFEMYRDYAKTVNDLKVARDEMNSVFQSAQKPYFIYVPEFDFSIRGNSHSYGNLKMEVFFRPPKDNLFRLPFLNIGFKTDRSTVIYACIHMNAFDQSKNVFYIYFLNTTKLFAPKLTDVFVNTPMVVRHILTLGRQPQAMVTPIPFVANPLQFVGGMAEPLSQVVDNSNFSILTNTGIIDFIGKLNFLDITSNLNPIQKVIMDNIDIGIKGVLIRPGKLKIRYAGSTLYGLLTFNLIQQSYKSEFSYFMNAMTVKESEMEEQIIVDQETVKEH